jgi:hypothetical protein
MSVAHARENEFAEVAYVYPRAIHGLRLSDQGICLACCATIHSCGAPSDIDVTCRYTSSKAMAGRQGHEPPERSRPRDRELAKGQKVEISIFQAQAASHLPPFTAQASESKGLVPSTNRLVHRL